MYVPDAEKYDWLIDNGRAITNPLLDESTRLQAAVELPEALELLHKVHPEQATALIKGYAAQIGNFAMAASDPSESRFIRLYILNFTLKNGLYHLSHAGASQLAQETPFDRAAFSIAETATQNIDLAKLKKTMHEIMADPTDDIEVREDALKLHFLIDLHEAYKFRQIPPDFRDQLGVYLDSRP